MSDKEPRRRKKRKDSAKKDDMRSEDHTFMPMRSESKDSDPEIEEETPLPIHQPSAFAKLVFIILFSGLIVSMSFIFISLHGADRGAVDLFDDHHSDEHISIESIEQIENISLTKDSLAESEHSSEEENAHEEVEPWSSSEFLPENLLNMLPNIGNILSFNKEKDDKADTALTNENIEESDILEELQKLSETDIVNSNQEKSIDTESNIRNNEEYTEDISHQQHFEDRTESPQSDEDTYHGTIEEVIEPPVEASPITEKSSFEEDLSHFAEEQYVQDYSSSSPPPEPVTEREHYSDEILFTNNEDVYEEQLSSQVPQGFDATPDYEEEDRLLYEKAFITNEDDYGIREELDELDALLGKSAEHALKKCEQLLKLHPESPRLHYVKGQALDKLAETERSNKLLEEAILTYQRVLDINNTPEALYLLAGKKSVERMHFRGFMGKSVKLLIQMLKKYPMNIELKNLLAVGYLLIGQNKAAKNELVDVLKLAPESGFAKVHLGFILKTDESNYEDSVNLLRDGINSRENGVIDGRFYFHLGDALQRLGRTEEALKVYDDAVKEGLFLSRYQRSLYNVNGLTAKPWWNPKETTYAPYFKILERDWILIRDEALSLTNEKSSGFLPETEGLQDTGDWKQFELYSRGRKVEKNCAKAPKTCALISQMPDAASCKRGQVKFSIMHPSTHVWAHTGPTNCRLRAHLGLVVPDGASIRVADEIRHWQEGKVIVFDDSFEHEVWHNGNSSRLVLIVDFWHPELTPYQKRSLTPI